MTTDAELAVQGYIDLGNYLLAQWGGLAQRAATQLDTGTLTADNVTKNLADTATLALQSFGLLVNEALDAAAVLSGAQDQPHIVDSDTFSISATTAVPGPHTLRLAGPLVADLGNDTLPVSVVTIVPPVLAAGETDFHLEADATGHQALGYSGTVDVLDAAGSTVDSVQVWLTA